jgi:amidase
MEPLTFRTASDLAAAIRKRELSSSEVVEAFLERIERLNPTLRALVTVDVAAARARAGEADASLRQGCLWGPLHGVPITFKDAFETAGMRTTCGFEPLARYLPARDATVVARVRAAGAIVLGKSNLPRLLGDVQTASHMFGTAKNPWDPERTPGGSSGGEAAAVACGLSPLGFGSDFGGSVRLPAHFCGVLGLKPTEHLVSTAGHIPPLPGKPVCARIMATPGPLARSIPDLALALSLVAGPDDRDLDVAPVSLVHRAKRPTRELRIAWVDALPGVEVASSVRDAVAKTASALARAGVTMERAHPEIDSAEAMNLYADLYGAMVIAPLRGMPRFGMRLAAAFARDPYHRRAGRRAGATTGDWFSMLAARDRLANAFEDFLRRFDAWLCPAASVVAFPHRDPYRPDLPVDVDGAQRSAVEALMAHLLLYNLGGQPAVTIPVGRSPEGLPIGVQLGAARWRDMELLDVAERVLELTGGFVRPRESA